MATIKDIAKKAGVSFTTVSNVIHGNEKRVSRDTIEKIERIMKELNYVPNMGARMLVGNKSKIIGVISNISAIDGKSSLQNPFAAEIIGEIEQEIRKQGYYMMLYSAKNTQEIEQLMTRWNVDGIITIGVNTDDSRKIGTMTDKPAVFTDCYFMPEDGLINVGTEDEKGAYLAIQYLIQLGHSKIGFVDCAYYQAEAVMEGVGEQRLKGYQRALKEAKIPFQEAYYLHVDEEEKKREKDLERIYERIGEFTALFFCADYYAIEMIDYLHHKGVKVPEDISIVGFDDITTAKLCCPRLTTVRQDIDKKGNHAVRQLISLIENGVVSQNNIRIPIQLIVRESARNIQ